MKVTGLDKLTRQLEDAGKAAAALNGPITTVQVTRGDPESLASAIRQMESEIDGRVARWRGNALVDQLVDKSKASFRARLTSEAGL